jgi:hypothetical protein
MLRLALVVLAAVVMAVVGYQLLFRDGAEMWTLDRQSFYFVWPSVVLWVALAPVVSRHDYVTAVGWGVLSPIVGALFVAGPVGIFAVLAQWYVTFPVGVVTGVLVKFATSVGKDGSDGLWSRPRSDMTAR